LQFKQTIKIETKTETNPLYTGTPDTPFARIYFLKLGRNARICFQGSREVQKDTKDRAKDLSKDLSRQKKRVSRSVVQERAIN
jgi:hypothetical protein